jgi:hypothetical protein
MILLLRTHYGGISLNKKIMFIIFFLITLFGGIILFDYYRLPAYKLDTETGTLIKNGITYKHSSELLTKYMDNEIKPIEKPIGRLKGDNPLWAKSFIYKLDGVSEEAGFMMTYPEMNFDFYEKVSE